MRRVATGVENKQAPFSNANSIGADRRRVSSVKMSDLCDKTSDLEEKDLPDDASRILDEPETSQSIDGMDTLVDAVRYVICGSF